MALTLFWTGRCPPFINTYAYGMEQKISIHASHLLIDCYRLVNIVTAGGIIDYIVICVNYIFFYRACLAQGVNRHELPYYGYFQPWSTVFALSFEICVVVCYGYVNFMPGSFSISSFFTHYAMVFLGILTFSGWKIFKRTKFVKPLEADLVWDRPAIERYELTTLDRDVGFFREMMQLLRIKKKDTVGGEEVVNY
jgi:yeast amino acid transporter